MTWWERVAVVGLILCAIVLVTVIGQGSVLSVYQASTSAHRLQLIVWLAFVQLVFANLADI